MGGGGGMSKKVGEGGGIRKTGCTCRQRSTSKSCVPRDGIHRQRVPIRGTGLDRRLVRPARLGFFLDRTGLGAEEKNKKDSQSGKG